MFRYKDASLVGLFFFSFHRFVASQRYLLTHRLFLAFNWGLICAAARSAYSPRAWPSPRARQNNCDSKREKETFCVIFCLEVTNPSLPLLPGAMTTTLVDANVPNNLVSGDAATLTSTETKDTLCSLPCVDKFKMDPFYARHRFDSESR